MSGTYRDLMALAGLSLMAEPPKGAKNRLNRDNVSIKKPKRVIPKGCELFEFSSRFGLFECVAINRKSARKKFDKWLNSQSND